MISFTGSALAVVSLVYWYKKDEKDLRGKDRPYKKYYTVYRPDDPRIENLKARPQYYNPEGVIPHPSTTENKDVVRWYGPKTAPIMADGTYAVHSSLACPTTPVKDNKTLDD